MGPSRVVTILKMRTAQRAQGSGWKSKEWFLVSKSLFRLTQLNHWIIVCSQKKKKGLKPESNKVPSDFCQSFIIAYYNSRLDIVRYGLDLDRFQYGKALLNVSRHQLVLYNIFYFSKAMYRRSVFFRPKYVPTPSGQRCEFMYVCRWPDL